MPLYRTQVKFSWSSAYWFFREILSLISFAIVQNHHPLKNCTKITNSQRFITYFTTCNINFDNLFNLLPKGTFFVVAAGGPCNKLPWKM